MQRTTACVLSLLLVLPCAAMATTSPDGSLPPSSMTVAPGTTFTDLAPAPNAVRDGLNLNPGEAPEGDYLGEAVFTRDGQRVLLTNRLTDNVTVYDAEGNPLTADIDVGTYPGAIAASDDYAVVACAFSDEVWIIDLADYSIAAVLPSGEQPWVVRISPDGTRAYVACDIDDVCEVYDLTTLTHELTITSFPVSLVSFSFGSENGRNAVTFTNFEVTPDGQYLMVGDRDMSVLFFDHTTGAVAETVGGIVNCPTVGLSGDGNVAVALGAGDPARAWRIDLSTFAVTGAVTVAGYSLRTYAVGVDQIGTKAFLGVSNNSSAIVRFDTADYGILTATYTPFAIGTSPDHELALGIQYRWSVVDFATEQVIGQLQGISLDHAAVSPVGTRTAAFHPVFSELVSWHDYSEPTSPQLIASTPAGLAPEGDGPRRVAIAADHSRVLVTNVMSDNLTCIDPATAEVVAILPMGDRVQNVAITSDSRWAVVCGFNSNSVFIVDLASDTVVAEVPAGVRAGVVSLAPDDSRAYVGNIQGNTVSVIALDGADSEEIAEVSCGVIGVVWAAYGVSSGVVCSPTGEYVLIAASFDDQVKVLDTATNTIVASLPVPDFPLQIAFDRDGAYATVTNYFSNDYTVIEVDGASSSVVGTFAAGSRPLRTAYHHTVGADWLGIAHYDSKNFVRINPQSGQQIESWSYAAYGNLVQAEFGGGGEPIALTAVSGDGPAMVHFADMHFELPANPASFGISDDHLLWAVAMPGPDYVSLFQWATTGAPEIVNVPLQGPGRLTVPAPNPTSGTTRIGFVLNRNTDAALAVYDLRGRKVAGLAAGSFTAGDHHAFWDGRDSGGRLLPAGTYCVELRVGTFRTTQKVMLTH